MQAENENSDIYHCLSDFVAPKGSGVDDYLGMFACTAGHGLDEVIKQYKEVGGSEGQLQGWDSNVHVHVGGPSAHNNSIPPTTSSLQA